MLSRYNPLYLWWLDLHKPTIYSVCFLLITGILGVFSASYQVGDNLNVSHSYFLNKHISFIIIGFVAFFVLSFQNRNSLMKISQLGFVCCIFAMIAIFGMSGKSVKGAERWLDLKIITIQPSELLKPFFIVITAYVMYYYESTKKFMYVILQGALYCVIVVLLFLQPDFGMILTYTFLMGVAVLYSSIRIKTLLYLTIPVILIILIAIFTLPHVKLRVQHFFKGEKMYQAEIAYNTVKNGGFFGVGLGAGEVSKRLPDSHNDFIFSRITEEMGGLYVIGMLGVFGVLFFTNLIYINKEYDLYTKLEDSNEQKLEQHKKAIIIDNYIILLIVALLFFEVFVNVAVNLSLIPPKGMVLPFVSYGGSSMLAHMMLIGMLCVVNRRKYRFIPMYQG